MQSIYEKGDYMEILPYSVEKRFSIGEKKQYYNQLRNYCKQLSLEKSGMMSLGQNAISKVYMKDFYHNMLQIEGIQNIPNSPAIILCNHSTAHDIFSMYIAMAKLGLPTSVMVATDCLNPFSIAVFAAAQSVFLDRNDKVSSSNSIFHASATLFAGKYLVIFGESTWNLHPTKKMQDIKKGASMISAITGFPIVPAILEYVENPYVVEKENEIYKKIVLRFGKSHEILPIDDLSFRTLGVQKQMEELRKSIWTENNVDRTTIPLIDSNIYLNHTYLKKFGVFGFTYDSEYEAQFLRSNEGKLIENEYCLSENNEFIPGITYKKK